MSTSASPVLQLDVAASCALVGAQRHRLGHHMAGLFLWLLWQARHAGHSLDKQTLVQAWQARKPGAQPDRTALLRVLAAAERFLEQLPDPLRAGLAHGPRGRTSGPWSLQAPEGSPWLSAPCAAGPGGTTAAAAALEPVLGRDPLAAHASALWLARADLLLSLGDYEGCAQALRPALPQPRGWAPALPPDAGALLTLRWIRVMRRLGRQQDTRPVLQRLNALCGALSPLWQHHVRGQCALLHQRELFDDTPRRASAQALAPGLEQPAPQSPCPQALAEWNNLRALTLRRTLLASSPVQARLALSTQALQHAQAAHFWSWVAGDAWWQQATAVNYGHLLEQLWTHRVPGGDVVAALRWFSLANQLVDQFNLPQDSAWEFIMIGLLYRSARHDGAIDLDEWQFSWPEGADPRQPRLYQRALELARRFGNVRQNITALNLAAWWAASHPGHGIDLSGVRMARDALIEAHPEIWSDLLLDGERLE